MRHATLCLLALAGGLWIASIGACGGKVIVDGTADEDGTGGKPPVTTNSGETTFSGPGCSFPAPVGAAVDCGASGSTGPSMLTTCALATCDEGHNQFLSNCAGDACVCSYNPAKGESFGCACSLKEACQPGKRDCCPFPF